MKILIAIYAIQDPGGIVNTVEHLVVGLRQLKHSVDTALLWPAATVTKSSHTVPHVAEERSVLYNGVLFNPQTGWWFPPAYRWPVVGDAAIAAWRRYASTFDLVVWEIPVPPLGGKWSTVRSWPELYKLPSRVKQIAVCHDSNLIARTPYCALVTKHWTGIATHHMSGYREAAVLGLPSMMFGIQMDGTLPAVPGWAKRKPEWFSLQTFKKSKRVEDTVRAVPHMRSKGTLAGGGINYYYMTSKEKTKPEYLDAKGRRIWDVALRTKRMNYLGWIDNAARDQQLRHVRVLIDASWSKNFKDELFNTVVFEALKQGALPVVRSGHGTIFRDDGVGDFFSHGVNCWAIPSTASAEEFAAGVDKAIHLPASQAEKMIAEGRKLVVASDRVRGAKALLSLLTPKPFGLLPDLCADPTRTRVPRSLMERARQSYEENFPPQYEVTMTVNL